MRIIKSMEEKYLLPALALVEAVFTDHESAEEGKLVRTLVEEIRSKRFYLPELELIMVDSDTDEVIGFVMFSRFHLEGKYEDELLLLSPVAVKTELQRQHISKELIEYGFEKAKTLGYKAVIVEGRPESIKSTQNLIRKTRLLGVYWSGLALFEKRTCGRMCISGGIRMGIQFGKTPTSTRC